MLVILVFFSICIHWDAIFRDLAIICCWQWPWVFMGIIKLPSSFFFDSIVEPSTCFFLTDISRVAWILFIHQAFYCKSLTKREAHTRQKRRAEWHKTSYHDMTVKSNILCICPIQFLISRLKSHYRITVRDSGAFCKVQEMSKLHGHHRLFLR